MKINKKVKKLSSAVFEEWHNTGTKLHIWNGNYHQSYRVCGVNKSFGGSETLCQGLSFKDWLKKKKYTI